MFDVAEKFDETGLSEFEVLYVSAIYELYLDALNNTSWYPKLGHVFSDEIIYDLFISSTFYEFWLEQDEYVYEVDVNEWANNVITEIENTIDTDKLLSVHIN